MLALFGLVVSYGILLTLAGVQWRGRTARHWIVLWLAVIQTAWVLLEMFTMKVPSL